MLLVTVSGMTAQSRSDQKSVNHCGKEPEWAGTACSALVLGRPVQPAPGLGPGYGGEPGNRGRRRTPQRDLARPSTRSAHVLFIVVALFFRLL